MTTKSVTLDDTFQLRCKHVEKQQFVNHCRLKLKRPSPDVMREMMIAIVDGRLTITPTDEQRTALKDTYNVD